MRSTIHTPGFVSSPILSRRLRAAGTRWAGRLIAAAVGVLWLTVTPLATAGIDGTIEQVVPISAGGTTWSSGWSATSTAYSPTDDSMGLFHWDASKYDGTVTVYFEAVLRSSATTNTATVGLFASGDTTTPVATVTTASLSFYTRVRSSAVTLTDGTDYTIRTKNSEAGQSMTLNEARVIIVQSSNWPSPIAKTETQIELGDIASTTSTTYVIPGKGRLWTLPDVSGGAVYDGNPTCHLEGVLGSSDGAQTATLALIGTAGIGSPLSTVSTSNTALTRVRSAAFTCNTAQDVVPELKISGGGATAALANARIVIDQHSSSLSKLETALPISAQYSVTTSTTWLAGGKFLWEPANYSASPAADMTVTAPYSGVTYSVTANSASAQLCDADAGDCLTATPLSGSLQSNLSSTTGAWSKSGAVTMPSSSTNIRTQLKMNAAGTFRVTHNYLPIDIVFNGSLQLLQSPSSTTLPGVTLDGTAQSTTGALGNIRVKDNRPSAPGWTVTASSTNFASNSETIAASKASASPRAVTTPDGSSLTGVSAGGGGTLDVSRVLSSATAGNGLGTYDENPNETVNVDTTVKTGTYTATLTITLA